LWVVKRIKGRILVHGYGLLDGKGQEVIAGSKMSGLTLYNTILVEGLSRVGEVAFLSGRLSHVDGIVEKRKDSDGRLVYEYDARFSDVLEEDGVFRPELAQLFYQNRVSDSSNPIYQKLVQVYEEVLRDFQPSVVNVHNLNATAAFIWSVLSLPDHKLLRAIATLHDLTPNQLEFVNNHQENIDTFIAISQSVGDSLRQAVIEASRIHYIPNGLQLEPFQGGDAEKMRKWSQIAKREGIAEKSPFQVLVPARRVPGKGIETGIRGFNEFCERGYGRARLLISGAGMGYSEYEQHLKGLANKSRYHTNIHFLGPVSYEEMPALFASSDVSLLPSIVKEGFGYSNIEAMATGKPVVVTTAQGGCMDYMNDGKNGILIPPNNADAIADALYHIASNPDMAAQLRESAVHTANRYSADSMIQSYSELIFEG